MKCHLNALAINQPNGRSQRSGMGWLLQLFLSCVWAAGASANERPNILFFFVDDLGRYAGVYAEPDTPSLNDIVQTPHFDRIGREGVIFQNAFMHVSSCTPSRASLTTARYFWNCGSQAFLHAGASDWSSYENPFLRMTKFPDLLQASGYFTAKALKTIDFTPSRPAPVAAEVPSVPYQRYGLYVSQASDEVERAQRIGETLNHPRMEMRRVLRSRPASQPFFFIYGTINVHRPYRADSGKKLWNIEPDRLKGRLPKFVPDVEDSRRDFADYLGEVQAADAILGTMLTELEAASGWIDSQRNWVISGRERHVDTAQTGNLPYPMRALRTNDYLYIRNFKPERWPRLKKLWLVNSMRSSWAHKIHALLTHLTGFRM